MKSRLRNRCRPGDKAPFRSSSSRGGGTGVGSGVGFAVGARGAASAVHAHKTSAAATLNARALPAMETRW